MTGGRISAIIPYFPNEYLPRKSVTLSFALLIRFLRYLDMLCSTASFDGLDITLVAGVGGKLVGSGGISVGGHGGSDRRSVDGGGTPGIPVRSEESGLAVAPSDVDVGTLVVYDGCVLGVSGRTEKIGPAHSVLSSSCPPKNPSSNR